MTALRSSLVLLLLTACDPLETATLSLESPTAAPVPDGVQRGWRRMDLDQLDTSIRKVTGGIGWDDERGQPRLQALAETLGAADYVTGTMEDRSVSLLFLKFLEDAAGDVCTALMEREAEGGKDNVFLTGVTLDDTMQSNREGIETTLSEAVLRFHGRAVAPGTPQLEPWTFLYESATLVTGSSQEGWRAVCVGLITHPDFYTY